MTLSDLLPTLKEKAVNAPALGKTLKFDFGSHQLFVDGTGPQNVISEENKDADCLVVVSEENFIALATGKLNPMAAVMMGKVKIKGDMGVAMKLNSFFS